MEIHSSGQFPPTQNRKRPVVKRRHDPFAPPSPPPINRERVERNRPMKFRFQHDLESLWWVALWILLYRVGGDKALKLVGDIFQRGDTPSMERTKFFTEYKDGLSDYIHDDLKFLASSVLDIRDALIDSYTDEEKTRNLLAHKEYTTIYNAVWVGFSKLIGEALSVQGVRFQNPQKKKRTHSESGLGDDDHKPHIPRKQCK